MKKVLGIAFGRKMSNTDVMVKTALMECERPVMMCVLSAPMILKLKTVPDVFPVL